VVDQGGRWQPDGCRNRGRACRRSGDRSQAVHRCCVAPSTCCQRRSSLVRRGQRRVTPGHVDQQHDEAAARDGTGANDDVYSLSLGRMLDARGEVVPKQRLVDLASQAGKALETRVKAAGGLGTEAVIGSTTVARAISAQSRIRQVQGRSSLLGDVAERLSRASLGACRT